MIAPALYIGTGIALSAAIHQSVAAATRPVGRLSAHLMFVLLCATVAGFTLSSAIVLTASPDMLLAAGKSVIATGFLCWFALLWFVTVSLKPAHLWIPLALSVLWTGLSLLNLAVATPLLYLNFLPSAHPQFGYPANATGMMHISQAWLLTHGLILATWAYALWCASQLYRRGLQLMATCWLTGLALLAMTTALDLATAAGWLSAVYISPLGWVALMMLFAIPRQPISMETAQSQDAQDHTLLDADTSNGSGLDMRSPLPALPHLPTMQNGMSAPFHWPSDTGSSSHSIEQEEPITPAAFKEPIAEQPGERDGHTGVTAIKASPEELIPEMTAPDADLASIIQFTRIALRRIERGKGDPRKFAALFRAILHKAETARDTLAHTQDAETSLPVEYDVNAVVAEIITQIEPRFTEAGIRIGQKLAHALPHVRIERHIVATILRDLLADAFTATQSSNAHKPVLVMTRQTRDGSVEVSVTDAGDEVSLAEIQDAFECLLQGLHIKHGARLIEAAEFVAAHGGQLSCTPNPAGGSIRHLRLPTH